MKLILKKIVESKTLIAFLILFSPLIISILIVTNGQSIGIPEKLNIPLTGLFYPYLQLVIWIYWVWYVVNRLGEYDQIDTKSIDKYGKVIRCSKVIFIILILELIINSMMPGLIEYSKILEQIVMYVSYGLIIAQFYLFYAWIYGFWIITKTLNDVYEKKREERSMTMILFFFMPFTFGVIHKKIRHELNL
ncbi:MAG: hypothetical protein H6537_08840 [Bacteroidales bacterium]|nr:hypothetical protein [Bacteroidales bacterium]